MIDKPKKIIKIRKCKKCNSEDIYKVGLCYEHYKEMANEKMREYRKKNVEKFRQYEKTKQKKYPVRKCIECGKEYRRLFKGAGFCSHKCQGDNWKKIGERVSNKNPGYRNGFYTNRSKTKMSKTSLIHFNACRRYRTKFLKDNDYGYCELCGISNPIKFETHHIVFASEAPKHKELHNFKNLIYLCINCHNNLHKHKILRNVLVEERGLNELFNRNLIIYEKKNIC